ncbi:MAG: NIL domain-containing protein [Actinomycetota bacterium]|jgi:ABC-type methionine transport system ATPase subunit|nr:NIL domain-containing protein [Actinomycetota bacterium]
MSVRVRLVFPDALVREPVLAHLARRFPVEPNIRRASVEEHSGWIVCELSGEAAAIDEAISWLESEGVQVELLGDVVES